MVPARYIIDDGAVKSVLWYAICRTRTLNLPLDSRYDSVELFLDVLNYFACAYSSQ